MGGYNDYNPSPAERAYSVYRNSQERAAWDEAKRFFDGRNDVVVDDHAVIVFSRLYPVHYRINSGNGYVCSGKRYGPRSAILDSWSGQEFRSGESDCHGAIARRVALSILENEELFLKTVDGGCGRKYIDGDERSLYERLEYAFGN